ncbi:Phospholipase/carboxylesterase [Hysterangium stoloniferum]|nr:Phospholipase/carboxylesterase [Hysterangium stoloniferum]
MANLQPLKYLVVSPRVKHSATVIFLHGLGDSGAGWEPVARMLQADAGLGHVKWVLPHARMSPVTLNGGMKMPSWYDIYSLTEWDRGEDERGLLESARSINEIITSELDDDVEASRIVLGGFSQGGAMSLLAGLTTERKLAGLIAMSSYLPLNGKMKSMMSDHAKKLPIFMAHGTADPVVAFEHGQNSYLYMKDVLGFPVVETGKTAGVGIRFEQYEGMGHSADPRELKHLTEWLKDVIPPQAE